MNTDTYQPLFVLGIDGTQPIPHRHRGGVFQREGPRAPTGADGQLTDIDLVFPGANLFQCLCVDNHTSIHTHTNTACECRYTHFPQRKIDNDLDRKDSHPRKIIAP